MYLDVGFLDDLIGAVVAVVAFVVIVVILATIGNPLKTREAYAKGLRGSREAIGELASQIASGH